MYVCFVWYVCMYLSSYHIQITTQREWEWEPESASASHPDAASFESGSGLEAVASSDSVGPRAPLSPPAAVPTDWWLDAYSAVPRAVLPRSLAAFVVRRVRASRGGCRLVVVGSACRVGRLWLCCQCRPAACQDSVRPRFRGFRLLLPGGGRFDLFVSFIHSARLKDVP